MGGGSLDDQNLCNWSWSGMVLGKCLCWGRGCMEQVSSENIPKCFFNVNNL